MTALALANIDGQVMPLADAKVPALDRGFLFGDAVYEGLRVYSGRPWLEDQHFHRLNGSLQQLRIVGVDLPRLRRRMHETIAAGPFTEATVYIQITRGAAPRAHAFPAHSTPLEFLFVQDFVDHNRAARQTGCAVVLHPDLRWRRCDIKSTNLLGNVLALQAARESGATEALLYLPDGALTEATHSSLFGLIDGVLKTAPKSAAVLPGVTRDFVLDLAAKAGIAVAETNLHRDELPRAQELFLTGTSAEVLPITRVDGVPVASGAPGPITRKLQEAYSNAIRVFIAQSTGPVL
jgi:D-alanine transaminase